MIDSVQKKTLRMAEDLVDLFLAVTQRLASGPWLRAGHEW
jgi:hypothetical protein